MITDCIRTSLPAGDKNKCFLFLFFVESSEKLYLQQKKGLRFFFLSAPYCRKAEIFPWIIGPSNTKDKANFHSRIQEEDTLIHYRNLLRRHSRDSWELANFHPRNDEIFPPRSYFINLTRYDDFTKPFIP